MKLVKIDFSKLHIQTKRLIIRPLEIEDYQVWIDGYSQRKPKTYKYDGLPTNPKDFPKLSFKKLVSKHRKIAKEDKVYVFGVFLKTTGQHIGSLDLATIQRYNMNWANLGYVVHNTFHGKGYAKEFVRAGIKLGFEKLGYKRIEAAINPDNLPSIALAKSVGMLKECMRPKFFYEGGKWEDHVVYVSISNSRKCWN
jgi:[ribosomal protein S5]-alanine N-acetyltransferase